jgi:hypothetical protein
MSQVKITESVVQQRAAKLAEREGGAVTDIVVAVKQVGACVVIARFGVWIVLPSL